MYYHQHNMNFRSCLDAFPSIHECTLVDGSEYMLDFTQELIHEQCKSQSKPTLSLTNYSSLLSLLENVSLNTVFYG